MTDKALENSLRLLRGNHCNCPGDTLTFECSVVGESYGITIWQGSALDKCEVQEISLRHDRFTEPMGARESCNNNFIIGQSLRVENGCYTSELNVTVTLDDDGKTIECAYYNVTEATTIGLLNISLTGKTFVYIYLALSYFIISLRIMNYTQSRSQ